MCRLLAVRDTTEFSMPDQLRELATIARRSKEYQGDGWGCAWWNGNSWQVYRSTTPIWEDRLDGFGRTRLLVAHARSAFRGEGIVVTNNMPFIEAGTAFAFNGELRGVRITAPGRIGAEKLFGVLRRLGGIGSTPALERAVSIVARRTSYVRAMNFVLADHKTVRIGSRFSEDPGYFTLHQKSVGTRRSVCSEPFLGEAGWVPLPNGCVVEWT